VKKRTLHRQPRQKEQKNETDWYFIGGKWITAEERQAKISRLEADISRIEEKLRVFEHALKMSAVLTQLAKTGDELFVKTLHLITLEMVSALNSIAEEQPEIILPISRRQIAWPAFISRKRALKASNAKLMEALQLGEGGPYSKRQWQLSARSTQAAVGLFETARLHKKEWDLPPLTEKNKRAWFEASWKYMLKEGIVPEETPSLAQLGKSAIGKRSISRGMSDQTEGMRRDDVRAEIKRQLWNAFDRLIAGGEK
jgi:hypothetical protein